MIVKVDVPNRCPFRFAGFVSGGIYVSNCGAQDPPKKKRTKYSDQCGDPYEFPEDCPLKIGFTVQYMIEKNG